MQKRESNIAKGLAVIFMYLHHLFGIEKKWGGEYQIQTIVFSEPQMMQISAALKICVAIFVFITAYGICRSLSSREKKQNL